MRWIVRLSSSEPTRSFREDCGQVDQRGVRLLGVGVIRRRGGSGRSSVEAGGLRIAHRTFSASPARVALGVVAVAVGLLGAPPAGDRSASLDGITLVDATVDIGASPATAAVSASGMLPGDVRMGRILVTNRGTGPLAYGVTSTTSDAVLGPQLSLTLWAAPDDGNACAAGPPAAPLYGPAPLGAPAGRVVVGDGARTLPLGASEALCLRVELPMESGNAFQNLSSTAVFSLVGTAGTAPPAPPGGADPAPSGPSGSPTAPAPKDQPESTAPTTTVVLPGPIPVEPVPAGTIAPTASASPGQPAPSDGRGQSPTDAPTLTTAGPGPGSSATNDSPTTSPTSGAEEGAPAEASSSNESPRVVDAARSPRSTGPVADQDPVSGPGLWNGVTEWLASVSEVAVRVAEKASFPLLLLVVMVLFLVVQNRIDRNDPKLALAPVHSEPDVPFPVIRTDEDSLVMSDTSSSGRTDRRHQPKELMP